MSDEKQPLVKLPGDEIDKAAAKVLNALAGNTAEGLSSFAGNIFGGIIGDRMRQWRTRNLIGSLEKTAKFITSRGIDLDTARALPDGELYALFDGASKADDETLQDMWAGLIAASLDQTRSDPIEIYAKIISDLLPLEAKLLHLINLANSKSSNCDTSEEVHVAHNQVVGQFTREIIQTNLQRLSRQNLIELNTEYRRFSVRSSKIIIDGYRRELVDAQALKHNLEIELRKLEQTSNCDLPILSSKGDPNYRLTRFGQELLNTCDSGEASTKNH